ncbi:MAG: TRAP transporter small permease subunit [Pseudomonadota bacterium]
MNAAMAAYVRIVDAVNYRLGRIMMYGVYVMMAILLWSSISKTFFLPSEWTLEMAQFAMVAYYIMGGPYSIQLGSNVRMDLFYGSWSVHRKAWFDCFTVFFLIFYLAVLLYGGIGSTAYSLGHFGDEPVGFFGQIIGSFFTGGPDAATEVIGRTERSPTAWRPYLWPIKILMCIGIFLMLLQAISELFKDIACLKGYEWGRKADVA